MSDSKEEEKQSTLKIGGTLKLQLNRPVDPTRLKTATGGKSSKTVTVEVRKSRSHSGKAGETTETTVLNSPQQQPQISPSAVLKAVEKEAGPSPQPVAGKILTNEERTHRLKAIQQAKLAAEEEAKRDSELKEKNAKAREKESELLKKEEEERRIEEKKAEELRKQKNPQKKKKADEVDLTETFIAQKDKKKVSQIPTPSYNFVEDEKKVEDEPVLQSNDEEKEMIISKKSAYLDTSVEYEDYSDDVVEEEQPQTLSIKTEVDPAKKSSVVRPVKGADRIIVAAPDLDKLKKNLRSEAAQVTTKSKARYDDNRKNSVRTLLSQFSEQEQERARSIASIRRQRDKMRGKVSMQKEPDKLYREVIVPETIVVQDLAARMTERVSDVVKSLVKMGMMVTANQVIDADTAELVIAEFGHTIKRVAESDVENVLNEELDNEALLKTRPPVVTVMGHVDHGKTTLLDALRSTDVAAGEAGGITQHIGAYQVELQGGRKITFIDTPGHEAFTSMRARGAKVTDLVILVVAADDGIKEQTVEAINHAKAAGVPIIVAVNKIDKPGGDPARVKNELFTHGLVPEEFGGDVMVVEVSAKSRINLEKLQEAILLQADILDLKANFERRGSGTVIEAKIDKGRGVVATVLVQKGTLKVGDVIVAGTAFGRVRSLVNDKGAQLKEAPPSAAVEVLGLDGVPSAGDEFAAVEDEKTAREIAEYRLKTIKDKQASVGSKMALEQFLKADGGVTQKELNVLIKGDVHGSVEAITASLEKIFTDEAKVRVLHSGVGGITESDVALAKASNAIIIGFNVRATSHAKDDATKEGVEIRYYSIIYELVDEVKKALTGILTPKQREKFIGYAEIRKVFEVSKIGKIGGCMVTQGFVKRGSKVRLLRDNVVIHEGWLKTLRRFKDDVKEVKEGFECGMSFENYDDIRDGDVIEASEIEQVAATLD